MDLDALGFETAEGAKLAWTHQNYGAYVVDNSEDDGTHDIHSLNVEARAFAEFPGLETSRRLRVRAGSGEDLHPPRPGGEQRAAFEAGRRRSAQCRQGSFAAGRGGSAHAPPRAAPAFTVICRTNALVSRAAGCGWSAERKETVRVRRSRCVE